ncbi:hypothetical protein GN958_ATG20234, partial [Phytophthora infestans]
MSVKWICLYVEGRRLRSKSTNSSRPHYAQLTLSIEKDHSSDEDYKPDDEDIDVDVQSTERGVKCGENTGHKDEDVSGEENKLVEVNKKEEEENKGSNPIKAKGTKRSRASQDNAASAPSIAECVGQAESIGSSDGDRDGYTPRKRSSNHLAELASMSEQGQTIENVVAPFPKATIKTW